MLKLQTLTLLAGTALTVLACAQGGTSDDGTGSAGAEMNEAKGPKSEPTAKTAATPPKFGSATECKKKTDALECMVCCMGTTKQPDVADTAMTSCLCRRAKEHCSPEVAKQQCSLTGELTPPSASSSGTTAGTTAGTSSGGTDCDVNADLDACEKEGAAACKADAECSGVSKCLADACAGLNH